MDGSGIPDEVAHVFPPDVRDSGAEYHREGRVRDVVRGEETITAWVRGTNRYDVRIFADGAGGIDFACTCRQFAETGVCKHIWATLISARRRGWLFGKQAVISGETARQRAPTPRWKKAIDELQQQMTGPANPLQAGLRPAIWPDQQRLIYVIDAAASQSTGANASGVVVEIAAQSMNRTGEWGTLKRLGGGVPQWLSVPDARDRDIAHMLIGAAAPHMPYHQTNMRQFMLLPSAYETTLRRIVNTERCVVRGLDGVIFPVIWDADELWQVQLSLAPESDGIVHPDGIHYVMSAEFLRGDERMSFEEPHLLLRDGLMMTPTAIARYTPAGAFPIVHMLREHKSPRGAPTDLVRDGIRVVTNDLPGEPVREPIVVSAADAPALLDALYTLPVLPPLQLPDELNVSYLRVPPTPRLSVSAPVSRQWGPAMTSLQVSFMYDGVAVPATQTASAYFDAGAKRIIHRDAANEMLALERVQAAGARQEYDYQTGQSSISIPHSRVDILIATLVSEGWIVEQDGRRIRQAGTPRVEVTSGIDWFDLSITIDFGEVSAALPELLAAWRRGERTVTLSDGSVGVLPAEWLAQYGGIAAFGAATGNVVRFTRTQVGLLDALLAAMPPAAIDQQFAQARNALRRFDEITPADAPESFQGTLRPYQRDGVGWLHFLREFGFGGCLADDMGLGKTVQVLAVLEARRLERAGPSLVVVPKSLVFNWQQEAARFTPQMRVLAHAGSQRTRTADDLDGHDLVITTYATLRRDAALFKDVEFDYVILDEAQAIKNSRTESAKAARLLNGRHRLAMTGTPVENRLEDLWSIFEFLNPGLLGAASVFKMLGGEALRGDDSRAVLARALRPFILRRTKAQVATDLPDRTEQTLYIDLEPEQRRLYDELRDHYRASLLDRVARDGINKAKIQILEALLRLRQAACHPGLIDPARVNEPSGKLDVLVSHVAEIVAEGHKVLVFSQFTTLLAIVRDRFDAEGITYEYLDGKTRDRQARVERFQNDPACPLFLISLKAGGVGLNLTAAEYVFLLDPWWNPAVEAQAIDRAHRIGQEQRVFATRLIARETVEEKVLQLQDNKRDLADAIINGDNSVISKLGREELELLLS